MIAPTLFRGNEYTSFANLVEYVHILVRERDMKFPMKGNSMMKQIVGYLRLVGLIALSFLMGALVAKTAGGVSIEEDPSEYPRSVDLFVRGSDGVALHRIPAFTVTTMGIRGRLPPLRDTTRTNRWALFSTTER